MTKKALEQYETAGKNEEEELVEDVEEDEEEEEEEEQEDEQINLRMFGIHQALPIPDGEPDWDSGPPETAEEYLRRVRAEAAACPRVVRVEFDQEAHAAKQRARAEAQATQQQEDRQQKTSTPTTTSTSSGPLASSSVAGYVSRLLAAGTLQDGPQWAQPSPQWVRALVSDFRDLRHWLGEASRKHTDELSKVRLPHVRDVTAWDRICFGVIRQNTKDTNLGQPHPDTLDTTGHTQALDKAETSAAVLQQGVGSDKHLPPPPPPPASDDQQVQPVSQPHTPQDHTSVTDKTATGASQQHFDSLSVSGQGSSVMGQHRMGAQATEGVPGGGDPQGDGGSTPPGDLRVLAQPVVSMVMCMDQVTVGVLLRRFVERLESAPGITVSDRDAQWMFALAAVLEKPAHSDVVASLRCLTRTVLTRRTVLTGPEDPELPRLNTLAVVAGAYFGQDEKLLKCVTDMDMP